MKKLLASLVLALSFALSLCVYASCVQKDISENVIRFHVKANSNSEYDQSVKLKVRDRLNTYLAPILENSKSIEESRILISRHLDEIESIANNCLKENGADYSAKAYLTIREFPTKSYENITLPSGRYNALCIDLGRSEGENWWCVMFPPLCLNKSTVSLPADSESYLKNNLNKDSFAIIKTDEENFTTVYRFKIFDCISSLKNKIGF